MLLVLAILGCTGPVDSDSSDTGDTIGDVQRPETLKVVTFNVESGDATAAKTAESIVKVEGETLWGLVEVEDDGWATTFQGAAADDADQHFNKIMGTTGWADKLLILWDEDVYDLLGSEELHDINVGETARSPLVAHLRTRDSGVEFLFMVNHLWRTQEDNRHEQARLLNAWGREQTLPVISVGDFNFDWAVDDGENDHDEGYDLMTEDGVWRWIVPDEIIRTQCSVYYDSVLDFVFVAGDARDWEKESVILEPSNAYCQDDDEKSDHRPVQATLSLPLPT